METIIKEKDLEVVKEAFGIKVDIECDGFINYRAYEQSLEGIEKQIREEIFTHKRDQLLKIRKDMRKILNEL